MDNICLKRTNNISSHEWGYIEQKHCNIGTSKITEIKPTLTDTIEKK